MEFYDFFALIGVGINSGTFVIFIMDGKIIIERVCRGGGISRSFSFSFFILHPVMSYFTLHITVILIHPHHHHPKKPRYVMTYDARFRVVVFDDTYFLSLFCLFLSSFLLLLQRFTCFFLIED